MNTINLSELTLENIGEWPMPVKFGAILGISLLIAALGYWFFIKPNFEQYAVLQAQEVTLRADFESKERQASNIQAYRNQLQLMTERFGAMLRQLPAKNETPGLLEEISKTGIASGLKFELFAPQAEVEHDFYIELPIKIAVKGSYMHLALFLSRVAQMKQIVTLHDFSIEGASSVTAAGTPAAANNGVNTPVSDDEFVMNITAKIYRYRT